MPCFFMITWYYQYPILFSLKMNTHSMCVWLDFVVAIPTFLWNIKH